MHIAMMGEHMNNVLRKRNKIILREQLYNKLLVKAVQSYNNSPNVPIKNLFINNTSENRSHSPTLFKRPRLVDEAIHQ